MFACSAIAAAIAFCYFFVYFFHSPLLVVKIICRSLLQETYEIEDCFKYDTTVHTRATDSTTDTLIPIYNDYSLVSDNFSLEFTFQASAEVGGVAIAPKGRTTLYHHIAIGLGANKLSAYIGNQNGGETPYRYESAQYNTDYTCKIEYDDGTVKLYVNNVLKDTITGKSYLNGETRDLYFLEWGVNETIKVKDIKVKAL